MPPKLSPPGGLAHLFLCRGLEPPYSHLCWVHVGVILSSARAMLLSTLRSSSFSADRLWGEGLSRVGRPMGLGSKDNPLLCCRRAWTQLQKRQGPSIWGLVGCNVQAQLTTLEHRWDWCGAGTRAVASWWHMGPLPPAPSRSLVSPRGPRLGWGTSSLQVCLRLCWLGLLPPPHNCLPSWKTGGLCLGELMCEGWGVPLGCSPLAGS